MEFEHTFFLDEVREGFYVSGLMKRFWAAQLEVLEDIDYICKKNNIKWFADYGTLIGAVRHGGYIPWDDDLDICMLREDYDKFRMVAPKELPKYYTVLEAGTDKYWNQVLRITNAKDVTVSKEFLAKFHDFPYPAGIDIFGLDNLCDDEEEEKRRSDLVKLIMTSAVSCDFEGELQKDELEILELIEYTSGQKLDYNQPIRKQLYELGDNLYRIFQDQPTKHIAQMYFWLENGSHRYDRRMFGGPIYVPFENIRMPIPLNGIGKLKSDYGNFMKLNRQGGIHDYPLFQHNEDLFIEYLEGQYPFLYNFKLADLKNENREEWIQFRQQQKKSINVLETINRNIISIFSKQIGEEEISAVIDLLETGQKVAIQIGEYTEKIVGVGTKAVQCLEEYCEIVYQMGTSLQNIETLDSLPLEEVIEVTERYQRIVNNQDNNRGVLILTARADQWCFIEEYYTKLKKCGLDVRVMVLPYYMRDMLGELKEEHYELEQYPADLEFVSYEQYDIHKERPWMVLTQIGHDSCNYTWSVNPAFYTNQIKGFTEQLIYISPYDTSEYVDGDFKMWASMEHFVMIPALAHSDQTVVHMENLRSAYIDYLCEKTGEINRAMWEERICNKEDFIVQIENKWNQQKNENEIGAVLQEKVLDENLPAVRQLMIYFSVGTIGYYQEKAIQKIGRVINLLIDNKEKIIPIWVMTDEEQTYLRENNLDLYKELEALRVKLQNEIPEAKLWIQENWLWEAADAYYGDESPYIKHFRWKNKAVMIERLDA